MTYIFTGQDPWQIIKTTDVCIALKNTQ